MFDYYGYPTPAAAAEATKAATNPQAIPHSNQPLPSFNHPHQPINLPHSNIPHQAHFQPTNYNHPTYYNPSLYRYRNKCGTRKVFFPLLIVGGGSYLLYKGLKKEIDGIREEVLLVSRDISSGPKFDSSEDLSRLGTVGIENDGEKIRKRWGWRDHPRRERDSFIHPQQSYSPQQVKEDRRI